METLSQVLPQDVLVKGATVPTSTAARTTKTTDVSRISVTNTTASTITYTFTDGSDVVKANISAIPIDPGTAVDFEFRAPIRCDAGIKDVASGAGLLVDIFGRRHTSWSMVNGFVQDSST